MPALEAAVEALNALNKADIVEVKDFKTPSPGADDHGGGVHLLGEKTDWDTAKKVLSRGDFMSSLFEYDKDNISAKKVKQLTKYVDGPELHPGKRPAPVQGSDVAVHVDPRHARLLARGQAGRAQEERRSKPPRTPSRRRWRSSRRSRTNSRLFRTRWRRCEAQLQAAMDEQQSLKDRRTHRPAPRARGEAHHRSGGRASPLERDGG